MLESFYGSDKLPRETIEKLREIADAQKVTITRGEYESLKRQVAELSKEPQILLKQDLCLLDFVD